MDAMDDFQLILARDAETLASCLAVRRQVFTVEKGIAPAIQEDALDCGFSGGGCDHFLMLWQGRPAGALRCRRLGDAAVQIQRFCVLAPCRQAGMGRKALDALASHYRSLGKKSLVLDAKFQVQDFYRRCGFQIASSAFEEAGIPHVKMKMDL